jgi:uroporphyrinogen-III synthase
LSKPADLPLSGCGIAITRPLDQAQSLAAMVRQAGGEPILFPLLEIAPVQDFRTFDRIADQLEKFDWAIFISSNAVQHGMSRLLARHIAIPASLRCAAVGPMTAAQLADFGVLEVLTPTDRFDSESLLNLPEMRAVTGKRCVIFRGIGGRDLLAQTLRERGATVEFAECYRRVNPNRDAGELTQLWQNGCLQTMVVTSSEALRNLLNLTGSDTAWLKSIPLLVNHPRIAEAAGKHGLRAITASAPGDAGMLEALINWRSDTNERI